jgi:hypothetical protein
MQYDATKIIFGLIAQGKGGLYTHVNLFFLGILFILLQYKLKILARLVCWFHICPLVGKVVEWFITGAYCLVDFVNYIVIFIYNHEFVFVVIPF